MTDPHDLSVSGLSDADDVERRPCPKCDAQPGSPYRSCSGAVASAYHTGRKYGGRPPVITDDMLHTVLRRRALGESVEQIQPDLIIPTGKREAYPEAVEAAHADFAALRQRDRSPV
ncbi:hypothetical protein [Streptomyces sp. NPDC059906]|uniref:zinc finger domain-containing protein n=1 Tax=Streptomyces sp. NPDC059906 TaxID=3346997 RepID=UPI003668CC9C